ncbi:hypothetical protein ACMFMG_003157 [Clarireedia jacksonii]
MAQVSPTRSRRLFCCPSIMQLQLHDSAPMVRRRSLHLPDTPPVLFRLSTSVSIEQLAAITAVPPSTKILHIEFQLKDTQRSPLNADDDDSDMQQYKHSILTRTQSCSQGNKFQCVMVEDQTTIHIFLSYGDA